MPDDVYMALAKHLDEVPIGAPMSDELMEILVPIEVILEREEIAVPPPDSRDTLQRILKERGLA